MKTFAAFVLLLVASPLSAALNVGNVGVVSQPTNLDALPMDGWTVYFEGDTIEAATLTPRTYISAMFRTISPGTAIDFKCRASDDGGTWLLFYRPNDDPEHTTPADFISGFEWREGQLHALGVSPEGGPTDEIVSTYEFARLITMQTTAPTEAGFVLVGSRKELGDSPFVAAATIELLSI